jgi:hypothetical protein
VEPCDAANDYVDPRIEKLEIRLVATDDLGLMMARRDYHRGIDHVTRRRTTTVGAGKLRHVEIEGLDNRSTCADNARDRDLSRPVPPYLADDPSRHDNRGTGVRCDLAQSENLAVALLDRDERARVKN